MEQSNEVILFEDEDVKVGAELADGKLFCHCYSKSEMTPSLMKKWRRWWGILKEEAALAGHEYVYTYTPNLRFCMLLDKEFEHLGEIENEGKVLEVLRWELTQLPSQ